MRYVLEALVGGSVLLTGWFVLLLGPPQRSVNPPMAWMLAAWAWVTIALESLLLLSLFRVAVSPWIAVVVLLAQDGIWVWRLVLLYRSRRGDRIRVEE